MHSPLTNTSTHTHAHTHTHRARHISPLLMTHNIYLPASIPPCTLLPDQCVVQTPTDSTHHLMDLLRHTNTHTHRHTHSWSQLGVLSELSLAESNYLSLSFSLSLPSHGFTAHRRRRAGRASPTAPKIGLPGSVSRGLKYKSALPPVNWSWPFSQGPAAEAVCGIKKKKRKKENK